MNLSTIESLRNEISLRYFNILSARGGRKLGVHAKFTGAGFAVCPYVRTHDSIIGEANQRVPLGEPLRFTLDEVIHFGPEQFERVRAHVDPIVNLSKLLVP